MIDLDNDIRVIVPISYIGKEVVLVEEDQHKKATGIAVKLGLSTMSQVVRVCLDVSSKLLFKNKEVDAFEREAERVKGAVSVLNEKMEKATKPMPMIESVRETKKNKTLGLKKYQKKNTKEQRGRPRRFSDEQIRAIREEREEGETLKELARRFECSIQTITRICKREVYTDVADREDGI